MKTLGDLGVLGEKKGFRPGEIIPVKKSPGHYDKLAIDNVVDGYNTAREEDSKIPLKDILSKIKWDEEKLQSWLNTMQDEYENLDFIPRLAHALIAELPNMLKE